MTPNYTIFNNYLSLSLSFLQLQARLVPNPTNSNSNSNSRDSNSNSRDSNSNSNSHSGYLEVKIAGIWGSVCADDFDDYDAQVSNSK